MHGTKEKQLTYCSGSTSKICGFFPPPRNILFMLVVKRGTASTQVQQEVFKLDKRKDYLAEGLSTGLGSQGDYGIRFSLVDFLIK